MKERSGRRDQLIAAIAAETKRPHRAGREAVRASLEARSMSAFNARHYSPVIGGFDARPVARGKAFMQAMTACMRGLPVLMNTRVSRGQVWDRSSVTR